MARITAAAIFSGAALAASCMANAQQHIPRPSPDHQLPGGSKGSPGIIFPDAQRIPRLTDDPPRAAEQDRCSLQFVSTAELQALRGVIIEQLAKHPAAWREDFAKAEAGIPSDCVRLKAVFYMRSLAKLKPPG